MDGVAVAGEVVGAGTALAGLILVYLGTLASGFEAFQPQEQKTMRPRFVKRAWIAFVGIILSLIAALLGILGKWLAIVCIGNTAVIVLLVSFLWGAVIAFMTVREIE